MQMRLSPLIDAPDIPEDLQALFLDNAGHRQALTSLAAHALQNGHVGAASAYADRLCRTRTSPDALDFLLRAEAARRRGNAASAARDVRHAVERDPNDVLANVHALRSLDSAERLTAARRIVNSPAASPTELRPAIAYLAEQGEMVVGNLIRIEDRITGWMTWPRDKRLICHVTDALRTETIEIRFDPRHSLDHAERCAADITWRGSKRGRISCRFDCQGEQSAGYAVEWTPQAPLPDEPPTDFKGEPVDLSVIVPVYEDFEATQACLDSLCSQIIPGFVWRIIIVNDASPNARIAADLAKRGANERVSLITNATNLGFAASINKAAACATGDLLLLNADTVLPPGVLARLLVVSTETSDVGTVTPLSNNGELTSFPQPYTFNDLPSDPELFAWDAAAAQVGSAPIDIPTGIGFCLLIKRACWDALGGMSLAFGRGYYEDIDLCLRARAFGFRNLCATNVIVGHQGSRSFGPDKRGLVLRNGDVLALRFPDHRAEFAAFRKADPLRTVFTAIERRIALPSHDVLLVTGPSGADLAIEERVAQLIANRQSCLILAIDPDNLELGASLRNASGGVPQSVRFFLATSVDQDELIAVLRAAGIRHIEVASQGLWPDLILGLMIGLDRPIHLYLSEALTPSSSTQMRNVVARESALSELPPPSRKMPDRPEIMGALLTWVASVICSDAMVLADARHTLRLEQHMFRLSRASEPLRNARAVLPGRATRTENACLAVLSPIGSAEVSALVSALSRRLAVGRTDARILVIGSTLNDLGLMAGGNVFVTGPVTSGEMRAVAEIYRCDALVLPYRGRCFHVLEAASEIFGGPRAFYDWSFGIYERHGADLALDPALGSDAAACEIIPWFFANL